MILAIEVMVGDLVPVTVFDLFQQPDVDLLLAASHGLAVVGSAIGEDVAVGEVNADAGGAAAAGFVVGDDVVQLVMLSAVSHVVAAVGAFADFQQPLSIEAETVLEVVDGTDITIVIGIPTHSGDGGDADEIPTPAQQSVPALAVIAYRELGFHRPQPFGELDGDGVTCAAQQSDVNNTVYGAHDAVLVGERSAGEAFLGRGHVVGIDA